MSSCYLCSSTEDVTLCKACGKHFCKKCKINYPLRVKAAVKEGILKLKGKVEDRL